MPFTSATSSTLTNGSKTSTPTPHITPGSSYNGVTSYSGYAGSASYGGYSSGAGRSREDLHSYGAGGGKSYGMTTTASGSTTPGYGTAGYGNTGGMGMDRPLPPRSGPGGYGHRPRSIDLVTPFSAGY